MPPSVYPVVAVGRARPSDPAVAAAPSRRRSTPHVTTASLSRTCRRRSSRAAGHGRSGRGARPAGRPRADGVGPRVEHLPLDGTRRRLDGVQVGGPLPMAVIVRAAAPARPHRRRLFAGQLPDRLAQASRNGPTRSRQSATRWGTWRNRACMGSPTIRGRAERGPRRRAAPPCRGWRAAPAGLGTRSRAGFRWSASPSAASPRARPEVGDEAVLRSSSARRRHGRHGVASRSGPGRDRRTSRPSRRGVVSGVSCVWGSPVVSGRSRPLGSGRPGVGRARARGSSS